METLEKHPTYTSEKISDAVERKFDLKEDKKLRKFVISVLNENRMEGYKRRTLISGIIGLFCSFLMIVDPYYKLIDPIYGCIGFFASLMLIWTGRPKRNKPKENFWH